MKYCVEPGLPSQMKLLKEQQSCSVLQSVLESYRAFNYRHSPHLITGTRAQNMVVTLRGTFIQIFKLYRLTLTRLYLSCI